MKDNREVPSDFKTELEDGLAPDAGISFALKVPREVVEGAPFRVHFTAREGIAPGIEPSSPVIGFVSQWTHEAELPTPRFSWALSVALAGALALVLAGTSWVRARRGRRRGGSALQ
jgi:hypothetical protein